MPTVKIERVSSFSQSLSFKLDDFNVFDPKLSFRTTIYDTILKGKWSLKIRAGAEPVAALNLDVDWEAPKYSFGTNIKGKAAFYWLGPDGSKDWIQSGSWDLARALPEPFTPGYSFPLLREQIEDAAARSGGKFKPETHRKYLFEFQLRSAASPDTEVLAQLHSSFYSTPFPNDARFFFPQSRRRGGGGGLELWTRLSALPLNLQDLLDSLVPQAAPIAGRTTRKSGPTPVALPHYSFQLDDDFDDDSDDEADQVFVASSTLEPAQAINLPTPNNFRQIDVDGLKYSTLKALLVYLDTGYIRFSPFKSFFSSSLPPTTRRSFLEKSLEDEPDLPLPVSPKSVYRLATRFSLHLLEELSLSTISSSLTVSNAAEELFSPLSLAHEEVQAVIIEFVGQNWAAIRDGESYKAIVAKIKKDEIKGAGKVLVDLIMAVQSK
ncbi:hypothetical protein JCM5350_005156 [Sporobolomyces pararoseus]